MRTVDWLSDGEKLPVCKELLKHLERDFAAQLVQTSGRLQNEEIYSTNFVMTQAS